MRLIVNSCRRQLLPHREVLVFGVIGIINTFFYSATVIAIVEGKFASPILANLVGFGAANTFSFFANSFFTFQRPPSWKLYKKFFLVSLLSLALTISLASLAEMMKWHYLIGLILVILFGPILTFALHKVYAFRQTN